MIILAIDSTEKTAAAAITDGEKLLAEYTLDCGNTHSETLLPMVESMMKTVGIVPDQIDVYACSAGPGSFTGVRIGVSMIKGLAFGKNKPCIGVSALEALAYNGLGFGDIVCPVMDARRNQVYNALFDMKDGVPARLTEDRVIAAGELISSLSENYGNQNIYLCGGGAKIVLAEAEKQGAANVRCLPDALLVERGYSVALAAYKTYISSPDHCAPMTDLALSPVYLRPSQAERTRAEG